LGAWRRRWCGDDLVADPPGHAGDRGQVRARRQRVEQAGERDVALPDDGEVDAVDRTDQLQSHLTVEVGAAEHGHDVRVPLLQPRRERERRRVLLEGGAEGDYPDTGELVDERVEERGDVLLARDQQPLPRRHITVQIGQFGAGLDEELAVRIRRGSAERLDGEQPVTDLPAAMLGQRPAVVQADPHREVEVRVQRAHGVSVRVRDRLEQPELNRRPIRLLERHRHDDGRQGIHGGRLTWSMV
jgi:hypothetical protein